MVKIGLEIHGYLATNEKLFCRCAIEHGRKFSEPNTNICPVCTAQPGSKPLLPNDVAIKQVVKIGLILGCKISERVVFQRKHYSWPDLPQGFQSTISGAHSMPNATGGKFGGIRITECHLEEDPAQWNPVSGEIDYNRSGAPLIEIVTEPDFKSSDEVVSWLSNLIATLSYVKSIDKNSGVKVDVNVSIDGGKRVEIKNINSLKKIKDAIENEVVRQEKDLPMVEETRMYDEEKKTTILMRTKDSALDYRFISEPDLPSIEISKETIEKIKSFIPELPLEKLKRLVKEHKIKEEYAKILTKNVFLVELFENSLGKVKTEILIPWITTELLGVANYNKIAVDEMEIDSEHFLELLKAVESGQINELKAKEILRSWKEVSTSPKNEIVEGKKISDDEIENLVREAIDENSKAVDDYRAGEKSSLNFLIGVVMKKSNKRADSKKVKEALERILK